MQNNIIRYSDRGFKMPDAIQIEIAECCGADFVLTNDSSWKRVKELNVITMDEL